LEFSPDGNSLLATISTPTYELIYLLKTDTLNTNPQNVTLTLTSVRKDWTILKSQQDQKFAASLPNASRKFILEHFASTKLSPEGDKLLYTASSSATMPLFKTPPLPSTNSTPETRNLIAGTTYVYQIKEDKNYLLYQPTADEISPSFIWHPSSAHVVFVQNKRIFAMEYDGGNKTTLYSGPFDPNFLFTWPDG